MSSPASPNRAIVDHLANRQPPQPSVGRIVHYVSYGTPNGEYPSVCRAAIVTEVDRQMALGDGWIVGLCVLNPTGQFFNRDVVQNEETHDGGTWHWPERV